MLELASSVGGAVAAGRERLAAAGLEDPRREADDLYALVVHGASSAAFLERERAMPSALLARYEEAVARRIAGWPPQYAAGRACFRGHWLAVDRRVLIPRPETEGLVDLVARWAAEYVAARGRPPVMADVGTGSGAIAIALALEAPVAGVVATDVSADALNVAMENAAALGARERIGFRRGPGLTPLLGEPVDAVVSNPPYVASGEWEHLEPLVRDHEPRLALDGGPDGLAPTREIVAGARDALAAGGLLALETDARRAPDAAALLAAADFVQVAVHPDLSGRPRYVTGRRPEHP
jgi:release factor glutamine methyltransferase